MTSGSVGGCLGDDAVFDFVDGRLDADTQRAVEAHLRDCADCSALVAELTRFRFQPQPAPSRPPAPGPSPADDEAPPAPLPVGTLVSRYVVGKVMGVGGGGVVQEAYDPQLQRKVALKLVRPLSHPGVPAREAQERLLREARTMAQLAHPHVVYVFDAGIFEDRVFIVMELVEGETLSAWLGRRARTWTEVLDVFLAAGRGLAAAHAANLVHRDFKPQNVLVSSDGRVRVTDFGLARAASFVSTGGAEAGARAAPEGVTLAGGTPAYMAPELLVGRSDARSDQFSFCVALFSALYGRHPFERWPPLQASERDGARQVRPPPDGGDVPSAVYGCLVRGLRADPGERHASMDDLLADLGRARAGHTGPRRIRFVAAALVVAAASLAGWQWRRSHAAPSCGNGVVEAGEECDDGNRHDDDACLSTCARARCGDGKVRAHVEECDDGNTADEDGCSASCLLCRRGDASFVWKDNGHCYSRHDEALDWQSARERCVALGGDLAGFANPAENNTVTDRLLKGQAGGHWIGLASRPAGDDFGWVAGEPWLANLKGWWAKKPKRAGQACAQARWAPHEVEPFFVLNADWSPAGCSERRGFLCEQASWSVLTRTGHAYRVVDAPVIWEAARRACEQLGAHLATITTPEEQAFVAAMAHLPVWLGAAPTQRRSFRWLTGEPLAFQSFAPGEPDDDGLSPSCLSLDVDDLWHDRPCAGDPSERFASLCEVD